MYVKNDLNYENKNALKKKDQKDLQQNINRIRDILIILYHTFKHLLNKHVCFL